MKMTTLDQIMYLKFYLNYYKMKHKISKMAPAVTPLDAMSLTIPASKALSKLSKFKILMYSYR